VLFVEDNSDDVELELATLRAEGLEVEHRTLETATALKAALAYESWDIIICDYWMPELSGLDAVRIAKQVAPAIPFILVSGTVGEDVAVDAMRAGADDYVLKQNLTRLASAVQRELRDFQARQAGVLSEKGFRLLADVGAALGQSLDRDAIVREVPALVVRDFATLGLLDLYEQSGRCRRVASAHADSASSRLLQRLDMENPPSCPEGWREHAVTSRQGAVVVHPLSSHAAAELDPALVTIASAFELRSAVSVPMVSEGRVVGAIQLARSAPYSALEVRIIEELARRIAIAIENSALYERAQRAVQMRDEFLSIAAHELRTPLTALRLQVQGLEQLATKHRAEWADDRILNRLARCTRSLDRLGQLIEALLDVSRVSIGGLTLNLEQTDLTTLTRDVVDRFQDEAERAISQIQLVSDGPIWGMWDRLRVEQVLTNLLSNALKYGAGAEVEIELLDAGAEAVVKVIDHGIGIPAGDLERIFGRFERAVSSRNYGGLGLGLFITRRIVEAHGGVITADATPAGGATLAVRLPKQAAV
jgi:signal transduction histidine kinase/ActR/RegA family two-component response regulator